MKIVCFIAAAGLGLSVGTAFAAEGGGDPFPFRAPSTVTVINGLAALPNAPDDPFPFRAKATVMTSSNSEEFMPTNGAQSGVQTANSVPPGFADGTPAYNRRESVREYRARLANPAAPQLAQHGLDVSPNG